VVCEGAGSPAEINLRAGDLVNLGLARAAVRPCESFPGLTPNHLRVAVRDQADNQRLVEALSEVLA
jgi:histidinol-phosphate/aromatic aminotransferase/cobyric acid decarboxylase-like protein